MSLCLRDPRWKLSSAVAVCALAAGLLLTSCNLSPQPSDITGSISPNASPQDTRAAMAAWSARYEHSPDHDTALGYAQALRANGESAQAVAVLQDAMLKFPHDAAIASAYGKALAANGDFDQALKVIRASNSPTSPDWRLLSAEAAILDQLGNAAESRAIYNTALKIAPDEPTILNNLALSHLLTNDLRTAESLLRKATSHPRSDSRIRQNLALVLGLEGRFGEAEQVARAELSPDQAEANVAYLKNMLSQQNTWRQIRQQSDKQTPPPKT